MNSNTVSFLSVYPTKTIPNMLVKAAATLLSISFVSQGRYGLNVIVRKPGADFSLALLYLLLRKSQETIDDEAIPAKGMAVSLPINEFIET